MKLNVAQEAAAVLKVICGQPELAKYVDSGLNIPAVYRARGQIRLVILGQDPTVKNPQSRASITTVLNLDKSGNLRSYLAKVCVGLGLELDEHIYATNYLKNFFVEPPTQIRQDDIFKLFAQSWLPLLRDELAMFPGVPVLALGQPLLGMLVCAGVSPSVRDYWGYTADWRNGTASPFRCLMPNENCLDRVVLPFPHQPSIAKRFYRERLPKYTAFAHGMVETEQRSAAIF